jgi:AcrR family transcriptional regulator
MSTRKRPARNSARSTDDADAGGRRRLIDAAARLGARARGITALGVRELGREAGLNPNTFYRHFQTLDDLGLAVVEDFATPLRHSLRASRQAAARGLHDGERALAVTVKSVNHFFDYVEQHQEVFLVSVRELHGASAALRARLRRILAGFAEDMAEDLRELELVPALLGPDGEPLARELSSVLIQQLFLWSLDYIEDPASRDLLRQRAVKLIYVVFAGATVLEQVRHEAVPARPAAPRRSPRRR